jgi:hypothetical protein
MDIDLHSKILQNCEETALRAGTAALENAYINDGGGLSRFPCLKDFCPLVGNAPTIITSYDNDMIAVTGGRTFRIDEDGTSQEITAAYVNGSGRVVFAETDRDLIMASGGDIVRYRGEKVELLSSKAPKASYVLYKDGYLIAIEPNSGRFQHSSVGNYEQWDPMDTFSAAGSEDNITSAIVSSYGDLMLAGERSLEMFDTSPDGDKPFYRRFLTPTGLIAPYTLINADNRVWGIDDRKQFSVFNSQIGTPQSDDIQRQLSIVTDFKDAWAGEIALAGQGFIVLQMPNAENIYGTRGITLLYDYRKKRWSTLYGWDNGKGIPTRWPAWSITTCFGRTFVGGNGTVYELTTEQSDDIHTQRALWRSAIIRQKGTLNKLRMHIERGYVGVIEEEPIISLRVNKDNRGWGKWIRRGLGRTGQKHMIMNYPSFGHADTWQFEIQMTDVGRMELSKLSVDII